jgi:phosphoglycolate phosphatase-like HAD superfamily hydrolase
MFDLDGTLAASKSDISPATAQMLCASTAREVAQSGHCSVVIVRSDRHTSAAGDDGWIVARVDESPDGIDVLEMAAQ